MTLVFLGNYALFLKQHGDLTEAESYYKRAIETDPNNVTNLGNYANFLHQSGNIAEAESYHKRAIEADPNHANILCNYGQFLISQGRISDGSSYLDTSFTNGVRSINPGDLSEICFVRWLACRLQDQPAKCWEQSFKSLIQDGFVRQQWSFAGMLEQAKRILSPEEYTYAVALSEAFLDEAKVPALNAFERWRELTPLDPATLREQLAAESSEQPPVPE